MAASTASSSSSSSISSGPTPTPKDLPPPPRLTPFLISLLAGAAAGITVDTTLFPLDTLKTRLQAQSQSQSKQGFTITITNPASFRASFRSIYSGLGPVLLGSAPGAALFFVTYDTVKRLRKEYNRGGNGTTTTTTTSAWTHVVAASLGELAACSIRVPTEVLKQRAQARQHRNGLEAFREIWSLRSSPGSWATVARELYRGGAITVLREIPFTVIQFPLWEWSKATYGRVKLKLKTAPLTATTTAPSTTTSPPPPYPAIPDPGLAVTPLESAICGSISGGTAALVTTPLDVLKTRLMLSRQHLDITPTPGTPATQFQPRAAQTARQILHELVTKEGYGALMNGWAPRVMWISIGGAVFLGAYDAVREALERL